MGLFLTYIRQENASYLVALSALIIISSAGTWISPLFTVMSPFASIALSACEMLRRVSFSSSIKSVHLDFQTFLSRRPLASVFDVSPDAHLQPLRLVLPWDPSHLLQFGGYQVEQVRSEDDELVGESHRLVLVDSDKTAVGLGHKMRQLYLWLSPEEMFGLQDVWDGRSSIMV